MKESKVFFFEKKKQKTFDFLVAGFPDGARLEGYEFLALIALRRVDEIHLARPPYGGAPAERP